MAPKQSKLLKGRLIEQCTTLVRFLPYILSNFRSRRPTGIDIELSNRCNLHCRTCWFHGENGVGDRYRGYELTTSEVLTFVDHLAHYSPRIYIGGSEPFMRNDFLMILKHIKAQNFSVDFTTNGTLLDSIKIEMLVALGVDAINFSIDGDEELNDQIRGKGVFKEVTQAIKELSECKKKKGRIKPTITVNITITRELMGHLEETIDAVRAATNDGPDFYRIHHLWFVTPNELLAHQFTIEKELGCMALGAAGHLIPNSHILDPTALAKELVRLKGVPKIRMFPNLQYADLFEYYSERPSARSRCIAPFFGAIIKPNGDVKFCPDEWVDGYVLGNIRSDCFDHIWNNKKARTFRTVLWRRKYFPACKRCSWMYSF